MLGPERFQTAVSSATLLIDCHVCVCVITFCQILVPMYRTAPFQLEPWKEQLLYSKLFSDILTIREDGRAAAAPPWRPLGGAERPDHRLPLLLEHCHKPGQSVTIGVQMLTL